MRTVSATVYFYVRVQEKEETENVVCCYCTYNIACSCIPGSIYSFQEKVGWQMEQYGKNKGGFNVMELVEFNLKAGNRLLLDKVNIQFDKHVINHVMGGNGVGKSTFAKACVGMHKYEGKIKGNDSAILIGSGSNVPAEFSIADIVKLLKKRFDTVRVDNLFELLKLSQVPGNLAIKKMSDGQKQKIKLLAFLSANPQVIILDEFTNALDKNSALDLYHFLSVYNKMHEVVIINITHNLSDLEYMEGKYYYIHNHKIDQIESKKEIIEMYVKGE